MSKGFGFPEAIFCSITASTSAHFTIFFWDKMAQKKALKKGK